jgi:glycosyltransferase involved in cell wall biosynthesis
MAEVSSSPLVSVVIPTLREDQIGQTLTHLGGELGAIDGYAFEILLVDDSAEPFKKIMDDATAAFNSSFAPKLSAKRVDGPRKGKGAALREGARASRGAIVFWMDADLPVPLENVERFLRLFADDGVDLVVAERPFDRNLSQPVRFVASRALFALQRLLVFHSRAFKDTQCGFKAFRGDLLREIAGKQIVDGGMADIEYLYVAVRAGARAARVGVVPNPETRESKINVRNALLTDPIDLVRIKLRGLRGGYR